MIRERRERETERKKEGEKHPRTNFEKKTQPQPLTTMSDSRKTCGKPKSPIWAHIHVLPEKTSDNKSIWKCNHCDHKRTVGEGKRPPASCWYEHLVLKCENVPDATKVALAAKGDTAKLNEWKRKRNEEMAMSAGVDLAAAAATAAAVAVGVEPIPMSKRYKASLAATTKVTPSTEELARIALVQNWLTKTLPQLYADDAAIYARSFVKEGFDSVQMLEGELLGDDLAFMKKAHRRALIRAKSLKESSPEEEEEKEESPEGEEKEEESETKTESISV